MAHHQAGRQVDAAVAALVSTLSGVPRASSVTIAFRHMAREILVARVCRRPVAARLDQLGGGRCEPGSVLGTRCNRQPSPQDLQLCEPIGTGSATMMDHLVLTAEFADAVLDIENRDAPVGVALRRFPEPTDIEMWTIADGRHDDRGWRPGSGCRRARARREHLSSMPSPVASDAHCRP